MSYIASLEDTVFGDEIQNMVLLWVRCGERELQIDTFILETTDIVYQTFPIGVEPFLVGFKGKQVVQIWVGHNDSLPFRVDGDLYMLPMCFHHQKMLFWLPTLLW